MNAPNDSTQLLIALVNSVRDDLKSDISDMREAFKSDIVDIRADITLIKANPTSKAKFWSLDWKHYVIGVCFIVALSFNIGREIGKSVPDIDSTSAYKLTKAGVSSTYVDLAKVYKLTNGNGVGN